MVRRFRILAVLFAAASSLAASAAHAGPAELGKLLRSPVGRYLLSRTPQGTVLSERLIGHTLQTEADLRALTAKLAAREYAALSAELEARLSGIEELLTGQAARMGTSEEVLGILNQLARDALTLQGSQLRFRVVRVTKPSEATAAAILAESGPAKGEASPEQQRQSGFAADLSGLRAGEFKANGVDFRFASLQDSVLPRGQIAGANLSFADLSRARLDGAVAYNANFSAAVADQASLRDAVLRNSVWTDAVLTRAQLAGADFTGADLRGADLSGAIVNGIGFHTADEVGVVFRDALFDAGTRLPFSRETAERLGMIFVP